MPVTPTRAQIGSTTSGFDIPCTGPKRRRSKAPHRQNKRYSCTRRLASGESSSSAGYKSASALEGRRSMRMGWDLFEITTAPKREPVSLAMPRDTGAAGRLDPSLYTAQKSCKRLDILHTWPRCEINRFLGPSILMRNRGRSGAGYCPLVCGCLF